MEIIVTHKSCSKCKHVKRLNEFPKCNRSKLGVKSECKLCHKSYKRTIRKDNWVTDLSDEYVKSKLIRSGFTMDQINDNPKLIELRRQLIILRRLVRHGIIR
jgi:hypothetical protein